MTRQPLEKSQWNSVYGWIAGTAAIALSISPTLAQPVPDTTLGAENSQVVINGPTDFDIDGGARRGANLFHSFQDFNVDAGSSVYFLNPDGIENILSRVTGDNPSNILGILGVRGDANLFLMNPNGILFGEESQLDIQGSFVGTTANAIGFGQGLFSTSNPEVPSPLLTVNPSAFFFNQVNAGAIAINSRADAGPDPSNSFNTFGLRVPDGRSLLLVGGDITADGGGLVAFAGHIQLASIADTGSVALNVDENSLRLTVPDTLMRGNVSLNNNAGFLATTGTTGGDIEITARNINILNDSSIEVGIGSNLGTAESQAGDIILNAQEALRVSSNGSTISNSVFRNGIGNSGRIIVLASLVDLGEDGSSDSFIRNNVASGAQGNTGGIFIETNSLFVRNGFQVQSVIFGEGISGGLEISARDLIELDGRDEEDSPSGVFSNLEGGSGQAGNININTRNLNILNRAQIGATTEGRGNAGNITINAQERVFLQSSLIISEVTEDSGVGAGGNIEINAETLELRDGGSLLADTENIGNAGDIIINASRAVIVEGRGPGPFSANDIVPSEITTTVDRAQEGEGGDISISTGSLIMSAGAELNSNTTGNGGAGNIFINARDRVSLSDVFILSEVSDVGGRGRGGNITILTGSLDMRDGSSLLADTEFRGDAGDIIIHARDSISLSGNDSEGLPSQISTTVEPLAIGEGGNISINGRSISLTDNAFISSRTSGQGNAGDIHIEASSILMEDGAELTTRTSGLGEAGNIRVSVSDRFILTGSGTELSSTTEDSAVAFEVLTDAGSLLDNAQDLTTGGIPQQRYQIFGELSDNNDVDIYRIVLEGNRTFSASTNNALTGRTGTDTRLLLFDTNGRGVYFNENVEENDLQSTLPAQNPLTPSAPGEYYLAVTSYENEAFSEGGNIFGTGDFTDIIGSTGAGGSLPLNEWSNEGRDRGGYAIELSGVVAPVVAGRDGGDITIQARNLIISNGATINAATLGNGDAGDVAIESTRLQLRSQGQITSNTSGSGAAGNITIQAPVLSLTSNALITANTSGQGDAGNISVQDADFVNLDRATISTTVENRARGAGGNISFQSGAMNLINSRITAQSLGRGNAGNILLDIDSQLIGTTSSITSSTRQERTQGGDITILANELLLRDRSQINAQSEGEGLAGNIFLNVQDELNLIDSDVTTRALGASGGDILINTINHDGRLVLADRGIVVFSGDSDITTNSLGDGGNITIGGAGIIAFDDSDIISRSQEARGGNITLGPFFSETIPVGNAEDFDNNDQVDLNATGRQASGRVTIPDISIIQNSLADLSDSSIDVNRLLANSCIAQTEQGGTFFITGPGGLPERPDSGVTSDFPTGEVRLVSGESAVTSDSDLWQVGDPIVEPQGVYQLPDGQLVMSREC